MANVFGSLYQLIYGLSKGEIPVGTDTQSSKLSAGTNGQAIVYDSTQSTGLKAATIISDTAYDATSWDGVTDVAPSKNAVRDKIEAITTSLGSYQPLDTELTAIAGLTSAADKTIEFTGSGTAGTYTVTTAAKTVLDDTTVSAMVDTLGGASATGTGGLVRSSSPTLVTPALGTPSSGTLTNCTGLPISTGVSGLGSNVATALATFSSANIAAACTDETGSGSLVFGTSPTFAGTTTLPAGGTSAATINWPLGGTAPTSPNNGDWWSETNSYKCRIAGTTVTVATTNLTLSWSGKQTFPAATTGNASCRITTSASTPSSPSAGDLWASSTVLYCYLNSTQYSVSFTTATETLSNKTFSGKTKLGATSTDSNSYAPSSGGTATLDCTNYRVHEVTMPTSGNITITPSGDTDSQEIVIRISTAATGTPGTWTISGTLTWMTNAGVAPTQATANSKHMYILLRRRGSGVYDAWLTGANF